MNLFSNALGQETYEHMSFLLTLLLLGEDLATVVVISFIGSHNSSVE